MAFFFLTRLQSGRSRPNTSYTSDQVNTPESVCGPQCLSSLWTVSSLLWSQPCHAGEAQSHAHTGCWATDFFIHTHCSAFTFQTSFALWSSTRASVSVNHAFTFCVFYSWRIVPFMLSPSVRPCWGKKSSSSLSFPNPKSSTLSSASRAATWRACVCLWSLLRWVESGRANVFPSRCHSSGPSHPYFSPPSSPGSWSLKESDLHSNDGQPRTWPAEHFSRHGWCVSRAHSGGEAMWDEPLQEVLA